MSKTYTCVQCSNECRKRDLLCAKCWTGLSPDRQNIIRSSTYRRDEVGKKFLTQLLTCDIKVIRQMIAESNGKTLEPERVGKFLKDAAFQHALIKEEQKKEAAEIV